MSQIIECHQVSKPPSFYSPPYCPKSDNFTFMVASDNHIGHNCKHKILKNDSFDAFQEILKKANSLKVDFLLLGGDLFDELDVSQEVLYKTQKILKENIFGCNKSIDFDTIWQNKKPNYMNECLKIKLPIFIINGNHDYPNKNNGSLATLDLLEEANYVIC